MGPEAVALPVNYVTALHSLRMAGASEWEGGAKAWRRSKVPERVDLTPVLRVSRDSNRLADPLEWVDEVLGNESPPPDVASLPRGACRTCRARSKRFSRWPATAGSGRRIGSSILDRAWVEP